MLKSSFFLEGTPIGGYAQWVITRTIIALSVWKFLQTEGESPTYEELMMRVKSKELESQDYEFLKSYFMGLGAMDCSRFEEDYNAQKLRRTIKMIDEIFVRQQLMRAYYEVFPKEFDRQNEIARLERRLEELRRGE
jgi:hypothetical protein